MLRANKARSPSVRGAPGARSSSLGLDRLGQTHATQTAGILPPPDSLTRSFFFLSPPRVSSRLGAGFKLAGIMKSLTRSTSAPSHVRFHAPRSHAPVYAPPAPPSKCPPVGTMYWVLAVNGPLANCPFPAKILAHSTAHHARIEWMTGEPAMVAYSRLHAPISPADLSLLRTHNAWDCSLGALPHLRDGGVLAPGEILPPPPCSPVPVAAAASAAAAASPVARPLGRTRACAPSIIEQCPPVPPNLHVVLEDLVVPVRTDGWPCALRWAMSSLAVATLLDARVFTADHVPWCVEPLWAGVVNACL